MQIKFKRLQEIIQEELREAANWPDDVHPESKWASGPVHQINDKLVSALQDVLLSEFEAEGKIGDGSGQMHENDLALEFEELLMDALLPIAEQASSMLGHDPALSKPEDDYEESLRRRYDKEEASARREGPSTPMTPEESAGLWDDDQEDWN